MEPCKNGAKTQWSSVQCTPFVSLRVGLTSKPAGTPMQSSPFLSKNKTQAVAYHCQRSCRHVGCRLLHVRCPLVRLSCLYPSRGST
eukprot:910003-Pelagomonas_calceolata.AAC.3